MTHSKETAGTRLKIKNYSGELKKLELAEVRRAPKISQRSSLRSNK